MRQNRGKLKAVDEQPGELPVLGLSAPSSSAPIPLLITEKIAVELLVKKQQETEQMRLGIFSDIAKRLGIQVSEIGTKYALFSDALIPQPKSEEI